MLKQQLQKDRIRFMKEKKPIEKMALSMLEAAIKNKEIEVRHDLDETQILNIIKRQIKEHKDSLSYLKEDKQEEINKYKTYINTLEIYLPEEMSKKEAEKIIAKALTDANVTEKNQKGLAMKTAMSLLKGKLDGKVIQEIVDSILV